MSADLEGNRCKADVKDSTGATNKCGTVLPKGSPECRNRKAHIWKFKSGFCQVGWCEGTQAKDCKGKYVRTCYLWMNCNCECHKQLDRIFLMTEQPRILAENPKYVRPKDLYHLRRVLDEVRLGEDGSSNIVNEVLSVAPLKKFNETPSGKRARGQLEMEVLAICKQFASGLIDDVEVLTPNIIADNIDEVEPPSVGAIGAVFDRWTSLGFAVCGKSPVRFVSFTVDGMEHGLDALKARAKMTRKLAEGNQSRSLRPRGLQ